MTIKSFEDLEIWQEARELSKLVNELTKKELFSKDFRFKDQIRSAAGSVMDNIAEGFERDGRKEFIQFLSIAKASAGETRSQSYRAFDNQYINDEEFNELLVKTQQLGNRIGNFIKYLKTVDYKGSKFQ